jgi:hypothetical protein
VLTLLAIVTSAVLAAIAGVHVYWAAGGKRWMDLVLPQENGARAFTPPPWITLGVAFGLFAAALMVLAARGWGPAATLPFALRQGAVGFLAAVFALRGVGDFRHVGLFRKVKGTPFAHWDARLFTPLCIALAGACAVLAAKTVPML